MFIQTLRKVVINTIDAQKRSEKVDFSPLIEMSKDWNDIEMKIALEYLGDFSWVLCKSMDAVAHRYTSVEILLSQLEDLGRLNDEDKYIEEE